jgi:hypothetical protein
MSAPARWIGKALQLSGLITALYALPAGLFAEESTRMTWELGLLAAGAAVFALGRLIEASGAR